MIIKQTVILKKGKNCKQSMGTQSKDMSLAAS